VADLPRRARDRGRAQSDARAASLTTG
jgi:hypothetical protein